MLTVKQLYEYFKNELSAGHGDYTVFVTDDEEANGYHALYYFGDTKAEIVAREGKDGYEDYYKKACPELCMGNVVKDQEKVIFIG